MAVPVELQEPAVQRGFHTKRFSDPPPRPTWLQSRAIVKFSQNIGQGHLKKVSCYLIIILDLSFKLAEFTSL